MRKTYQNVFLLFLLLTLGGSAFSQGNPGQDTMPSSIDPQLLDIFNSRPPKEYTIAGITVSGSQSFDPNLIISISGLAVGDKISIPGTDVFGKAINKLWKQNLIADVEVLFTRLEGRNLFVELAIVERPRLADFQFLGIKKSEKEELEGKVGLSKDIEVKIKSTFIYC